MAAETRREVKDDDLIELQQILPPIDKPPSVIVEEPDNAQDRLEVWWSGENDPENPYNWPSWRISLNSLTIVAMGILTAQTSTVCAPAVSGMMEEFRSESPELATFVVSIFSLGFAFGSLLVAPLSEMYGRFPILLICNICFAAFVTGCGFAQSLSALIILRFFSGFFGSCPIIIGSGCIADTWRSVSCTNPMVFLSIGPILGPTIGPAFAGFVSVSKDWRWGFWITAMFGGLITVLSAIFFRESYAPILLQRKVNALRKETGCADYYSRLDAGLTPSAYFKRAIILPAKILLLSPVNAICALYSTMIYSYTYLLYSTTAQVFQEYYNFSPGISGLVFFGLGFGCMLGMTIIGLTSDVRILVRAVTGREVKPEARLSLFAPIGSLLLPVGLFLYGWSAQYHLHWFIPILGMAIIGLSNMIIITALMLYLIDAYVPYAASSVAANIFVGFIGGGLFPLAGPKMYDTLGLGWGNSILAFIAIAFIPVPFLLQRCGERLRMRFSLEGL